MTKQSAAKEKRLQALKRKPTMNRDGAHPRDRQKRHKDTSRDKNRRDNRSDKAEKCARPGALAAKRSRHHDRKSIEKSRRDPATPEGSSAHKDTTSLQPNKQKQSFEATLSDHIDKHEAVKDSLDANAKPFQRTQQVHPNCTHQV